MRKVALTHLGAATALTVTSTLLAAQSAVKIPETPGLPAKILSVTLRPVRPSLQGEIEAVRVKVQADQADVEAGRPLLVLPEVVSNVQTVAETITQLSVSDGAGEIVMSSHMESASAQHPEQRIWSANRAVHGVLSWSYLAPISNAPNALGAAPPLELRGEEGGFSGQAATFLLLPATNANFSFQIHWDLSEQPNGAVGLSTFGRGDQKASHRMTAEEIGGLYFFGGQLQLYPERSTPQGFFSAVQGRPPFDGIALMQWTEKLYRYYFGFFRAEKAEPYAVLLRRNPINAGGGVELGNAFIGTFDKQTNTEDLKMTLAHEMVHTFVRGLEGDEFAGSWFTEGIAVYYERLLPLRAGVITADDFLRDVNSTAARYYTNALQQTPNSEIGAQFWAETRVRVLPYDRGSLYFAELDRQIRHASDGKRSLDQLILAMLQKRRSGGRMDEQSWRELLRKELGQSAIDAFDSMLRGDRVLPESDAFGPCFTRTIRRLRRYDLGFDSKVLIEPTRVVRGLRAESGAAKAGLRDGDRILRPVPQDGIQADQSALLHLQIERGGMQIAIDYLPRGEEVDAYQWQQLPGSSQSSCVLPQTGSIH